MHLQALPPESAADSVEPVDCASLLEPIRSEFRLPALAAALVNQDRLISLGAVGLRRADTSARVTPTDKFHLGSLTKSMTATLAAVLVEQRRIRWDTTLAEVFPDQANQMHPGYRPVTLEQLLAHRGGVPAVVEGDGPGLQLRDLPGLPRQQRMYLLIQVTSRSPAIPPGSRFLYSNVGYAIAGAMLEQVMGAPWEDLMLTHLFKMHGIRSAGFGPPALAGALDQPWGHIRHGLNYEPVPPDPRADNPPALAPAGAVHCSLPDLARYAMFHLRGARGQESRLKPASFAKLHHPFGDEMYALGWLVVQREWAGGTALTHAGSNNTFHAVIWLAPERNLGVLVAANAGGTAAEQACDRAAWTLIQDWLQSQTQPGHSRHSGAWEPRRAMWSANP